MSHQSKFRYVLVCGLVIFLALGFGVWLVDRNIGLGSNLRYSTRLMTTPNRFFWLSLPDSYEEVDKGKSVRLRNSSLPFVVRAPRTFESITFHFKLRLNEVNTVILSSPRVGGRERVQMVLVDDATPKAPSGLHTSVTMQLADLFSRGHEYQFFLSYQGEALHIDNFAVEFKGQAITPQRLLNKIVCSRDCK